jgi:hypothetical protein
VLVNAEASDTSTRKGRNKPDLYSLPQLSGSDQRVCVYAMTEKGASMESPVMLTS